MVIDIHPNTKAIETDWKRRRCSICLGTWERAWKGDDQSLGREREQRGFITKFARNAGPIISMYFYLDR